MYIRKIKQKVVKTGGKENSLKNPKRIWPMLIKEGWKLFKSSLNRRETKENKIFWWLWLIYQNLQSKKKMSRTANYWQNQGKILLLKPKWL